MATPTASPKVASTIGMKNVVIAPLTRGRPTPACTYGALQAGGGRD